MRATRALFIRHGAERTPEGRSLRLLRERLSPVRFITICIATSVLLGLMIAKDPIQYPTDLADFQEETLVAPVAVHPRLARRTAVANGVQEIAEIGDLPFRRNAGRPI